MNIKSIRKPQTHLINIIKATKAHHPNFLLFLGAGASSTSGVKVTSVMIEEWRHCYHEAYCPEEPYEEFLSKQTWYKQPDEYSVLFEQLYDQPSQRREYIESCISEATPSWGYIYLVNLIRNNVFNTVFTTNFDDLLNEACYQYSGDVRPVVCAHDSSIWSVRITSKRPKIIKLHGDFLFDNIKNTVTELETLESNMKEKFRQYAGEYGLIVIGYSGCDRSVMDTLNVLLRNDLNFPHGVYWCVRKTDNINPYVTELQRFPKFQLIEIEDFDNFFADIHSALKIELQPEMSDPYAALAAKLNSLILNAKIPEPVPGEGKTVIQHDIEKIGKKIANATGLEKSFVFSSSLKGISNVGNIAQLAVPLPYELLADIYEREGKVDESLTYLLREITQRPDARLFYKAFEILGRKKVAGYDEKLFGLLAKNTDLLRQNIWLANEGALDLIRGGFYGTASQLLELGREIRLSSGSKNNDEDQHYPVYILNKLQIKAHQDIVLDENEIAELEHILLGKSLRYRLGAAILLKKYDDARVLLSQALITREVKKEDLQSWPIFRLLDNHINTDELIEEMISYNQKISLIHNSLSELASDSSLNQSN